jgi:hypothetical protein
MADTKTSALPDGSGTVTSAGEQPVAEGGTLYKLTLAQIAAIAQGVIKLDDLAAPDDNTDLDVSTSKHGLMPKLPGGTTNFYRADGSFASPATNDASLALQIHNSGSVIATGEIDRNIYVPYDCTIDSVELVSDDGTSGSIVIDIWKDTYANLNPTDADSITASAPPTITTATKSQDATLTGWTTSLTKGDYLRLNVDSVTSMLYITLILKLTKSI